PLAIPGVVLILLSWWQQRVGIAMLSGLAAGAAFWLPLISWLTLYLGPIPWLALSSVMVLWMVAQGAVTALTTRGISAIAFNRQWGTGTLVLVHALAVSGIWVLREGVQCAWPYGGFAWGRIAHLFASSPFGSLVSWLGFAGLTGLVVAVSALLVAWSTARIRYVARLRAENVRSNLSSRTVMTATLVGLIVLRSEEH